MRDNALHQSIDWAAASRRTWPEKLLGVLRSQKLQDAETVDGRNTVRKHVKSRRTVARSSPIIE